MMAPNRRQNQCESLIRKNTKSKQLKWCWTAASQFLRYVKSSGLAAQLFAGRLTRYGRREKGKSRRVQKLSPRSNDELRSWKAWFVKRIGISKS